MNENEKEAIGRIFIVRISWQIFLHAIIFVFFSLFLLQMCAVLVDK